MDHHGIIQALASAGFSTYYPDQTKSGVRKTGIVGSLYLSVGGASRTNRVTKEAPPANDCTGDNTTYGYKCQYSAVAML